MAETPQPQVQTTPNPTAPSVPAAEGKFRNGLIIGSLGVAAAIIFGVLYLFVLAPSIPGTGIGWFLFSFATGLTMIVMPCTLPLAFVIVPLAMGKGLIRGLGMALSFGAGVAATLSLYGVIAALLGGAAIDALGADLESVKNWVYLIAGIFALLFALGGIGLVKFQMPSYTGAAPAFIQKRQDVVKAFMLGLFLGNVGVGCPHPATPLILIEIASSGDVLYGWLLFLTHAIGRILPLLLLAFLAILGVNGLSWVMKRKDAVERGTGWAMVFVAGFILTLGLFTHDWWVNSGIHSALEKVTQESALNTLLNDTLGTNVAHVHDLEEGPGMFGLPLWLGNWFLVAVWLIPIWWWYIRKRHDLHEKPSFQIRQISSTIKQLEEDRASIMAAMGENQGTTKEMKALERRLKRLNEDREYLTGERELSDESLGYEVKSLSMQRNYLIIVSIFLALTFIYFMPKNFYLTSISGIGHGDHGHHEAGPTEPVGTPFTQNTIGLADAIPTEVIELSDGDTYEITATVVKKEVGNRTLRMMAYNRMIPGPIIKAEQGDEVTIVFTNDTPLDQTMHHHGLRLDNRSDGVPLVTQDVVKPGETYTYTLTFPDAGLYWYHPHTRDDYGQELGLYGNYLIEPSDPDYWSDVNREVPLVIDDILITSGQIEKFYEEFTNFALLGRFGNEYLINGEKDYVMDVQKGEVIRFFVTNVSNARTYNISIPGASMKLVGGDAGKYELETFEDSFLISPSERVVVEVHFERDGLHKLINTTPSGTHELAFFNVAGEEVAESFTDEFNTARRNADVVEEMQLVRQYLSKQPDKTVRLTVDLGGAEIDHSGHAHHGGGDAGGHGDHGGHDAHAGHGAVDHSGHAHSSGSSNPLDNIQWDDPGATDRINTTENITWKMVDEDTGMENMMINWMFTTGDIVKVRIFNDPMADHVMQHPIHFHGQRFAVLARDGIANDNMVWKDTTLVLPGETVDIVVDMSNPGNWMAHCHIGEHLHAGMMIGFRVQNEDGTAPGDDYRATVPADMQGMHQHTPGMDMSGMGQSGMGMQGSDTMAGLGSSSMTGSEGLTYESEPDRGYVIKPIGTSFRSGKNEQLRFQIFDRGGELIPVPDVNAIQVTIIKDDNTLKFAPGETLHLHDDGHNHSHSWLIKTVHADAGHDHGSEEIVVEGDVISMPVMFPAEGNYRVFVEFFPPGELSQSLAAYDVTVAKGSWEIKDLGYTKDQVWWGMLIISILLMIVLSLGVRKYLKS